jgi:hypothetical protein
MEKAELIVESSPDDSGLRARCSLCGARFDLIGNRLTEKQLLRGLFDLHARRVHSAKPGNGEAEKPANT